MRLSVQCGCTSNQSLLIHTVDREDAAWRRDEEGLGGDPALLDAIDPKAVSCGVD